jgi:hypothetical protein
LVPRAYLHFLTIRVVEELVLPYHLAGWVKPFCYEAEASHSGHVLSLPRLCTDKGGEPLQLSNRQRLHQRLGQYNNHALFEELFHAKQHTAQDG